MFIDEVTSAGGLPVLEATMRFAGARHRVLTHNIANLDTPNFQPLDVSTAGFQEQLRRAVDASGGPRASGQRLEFADTNEVKFLRNGELQLRPTTPSGNVLFHDRNNRDLERSVQALVENVGVFRASTDLMRSKYEMLRLAMTER